MNYYYDIVLNFDMDHLWKFYEWDESDYVLSLKKVPLFHVSFETICDFLKYEITFDENFKKSCLGLSNKKGEDYAILVCDGKNAYGVLLDEKGCVLSLSSLLVHDELEVCEYVYSILETKMEYTKGKCRKINHPLRQLSKIQNFILVELNTLLDQKNEDKLAYLYYECFLKEEQSFQKMYDEMVAEVQKENLPFLLELEYLIRLSYRQVSLSNKGQLL